MRHVHAQSVDENDKRARLYGKRVRPSSVAGHLYCGTEAPRQSISPRPVERAGGASHDILARSSGCDRIDQRRIDPPPFFRIGAGYRGEVVARNAGLGRGGETRERLERPGERRFAELCPERVASNPMTLFEHYDFCRRLATRELRDFAELWRQDFFGKRIVVRARDRIALVHPPEKAALLRRGNFANPLADT